MNKELPVVIEREKAPEIPEGSPWLTLKSGDEVVVKISEDRKVPGLIDVITEDHSVLWVHLGAGRGRRLFHWQEDVTITRRR